jgi:hypothetical protein
MLQDVLDGTNIAHPKVVLLKQDQREVIHSGGNKR